MRAALRSNPGSNVFWTGRIGECYGEDDSVKPMAEKFARERGQKTLEMRLAEAGLKMPAFNTPDNNAKEIWRFASAEYARQSSGEPGLGGPGQLRTRPQHLADPGTAPAEEERQDQVRQEDETAEHLAFEKLIWHASGWKSKCKDSVHLRNKAAQACVVYDARDTNGPQDPHYGGSWTDLNRGNRNHWLYYYGWAYIGGQPFHGTRSVGISPDAKGYRYSIEPDSSGPKNPNYIVDHALVLIGWFRSGDKRPYRIEILDRGADWWFRDKARPYKEVCTFEKAVAASA